MSFMRITIAALMLALAVAPLRRTRSGLQLARTSALTCDRARSEIW